jgi:hypothetical protein
MQDSGNGLTFTDLDYKMCRVVIGLLSRGTFNLNASGVREASPALLWIENLLPKIKDNILDFSTARMVEPSDSTPEES